MPVESGDQHRTKQTFTKAVSSPNTHSDYGVIKKVGGNKNLGSA